MGQKSGQGYIYIPPCPVSLFQDSVRDRVSRLILKLKWLKKGHARQRDKTGCHGLWA